jgi:hypothetical protein
MRGTRRSVNARHQFVLVERLGYVVVGAEAEPPDFVLNAGEAREDQDRRLYLRDAQLTQHVEARHIRKVQIEEDGLRLIKGSLDLVADGVGEAPSRQPTPQFYTSKILDTSAT